jgi:hypothetical protein
MTTAGYGSSRAAIGSNRHNPPPYGSGNRFLYDVGWSSPVARRAHNAKVAGANVVIANGGVSSAGTQENNHRSRAAAQVGSNLLRSGCGGRARVGHHVRKGSADGELSGERLESFLPNLAVFRGIELIIHSALFRFS